MKNLISFIVLVSFSFNAIAVTPEPWSVDQFIEYSNRQRPYHIGLESNLSKEILTQYETRRHETREIPSSFWTKEQTDAYQLPGIPTVVYYPEGYRSFDNPKAFPVMIRTHGGPFQQEEWSYPRVEIAYWLSQGFIVLCPNYRGSTGYGDDYTNGIKKNIFAAVEDIYSVGHYAKHTLKKTDPTRIYLTGLCFGSIVNALLASQLGKEGFTDTHMFAGIHLMSGIYDLKPTKDADLLLESSDQLLSLRSSSPENWNPLYDKWFYREEWSPLNFVADIPSHIPLFLANGLKDRIALIRPALAYMDELLKHKKNARFFVASKGGHYISREDLKDKAPEKDTEYETYLRKLSAFFLSPSDRPDTYDEGMQEIQRARALLSERDTKRREEERLAKETLDRPFELNTSQVLYPGSTELRFASSPELTHSQLFLKSILKDQFDPQDLEKNIEHFLDEHYFKVEAYSSYKDDPDFRRFIKELFINEEKLLSENKGYYPAYHGAHGSIGVIYHLYSLWQQILARDPELKLRLRLSDEIFTDFKNIEEFLAAMHREHRIENVTYSRSSHSEIEQGYFNHTPRFMAYGISGNLFIPGGFLDWGSNSLDFFWRNQTPGKKNITFKGILKGPYSQLGIYRPKQIERYEKLAEEVKDDSILLQMALSPTYPAYLSDLGGAPVSSPETKALSPFQLVEGMKEDLEGIETTLMAHQNQLPKALAKRNGAFVNNLELVQIRAFAQPNPEDPSQKRVIYPYLKRPYTPEFLAKLKGLVMEDVQFLLSMRSYIPPFFFGTSKLALLEEYKEKFHEAFPNKDPMGKVSPQQINGFIEAGRIRGVEKYFKPRKKYINAELFNNKSAFQTAGFAGQPVLLKWLSSHLTPSLIEWELIETLTKAVQTIHTKAIVTAVRSPHISSTILKAAGKAFHQKHMPKDEFDFNGTFLNVVASMDDMDPEILDALIETKIDIEHLWYTSDGFRTPLHGAIIAGREDVVAKLLKAGAFPGAYRSNGKLTTTLTLAHSQGNVAIFKLIKEHLEKLRGY